MPNVFGTCFSKQIILLDVVRDRYAVLSDTQSAALAPHLGLDDKLFAQTDSIQSTAILEKLKRANWISTNLFPVIDAKLNALSPSPKTGGMSANGWKLPDEAFAHRPAWASIAKATLILRSVHKCAAQHGLAGLLRLCDQAHHEAAEHLRFGQPEEYAPFVNTLNWACPVLSSVNQVFGMVRRADVVVRACQFGIKISYWRPVLSLLCACMVGSRRCSDWRQRA